MNDADPILLRALTRSEAEATVAERRTGQRWARDYPTFGDVNVARAALEGRLTFADESMPWGLYVIVDTSSALSIGGIGFKGSPKGGGEVEIGYGVCHSFQGKGVATAAVLAMCEIASPGAATIIAETERQNVASQRVLEKSGFQIADEIDGLIHWRRSLARWED